MRPPRVLHRLPARPLRRWPRFGRAPTRRRCSCRVPSLLLDRGRPGSSWHGPARPTDLRSRRMGQGISEVLPFAIGIAIIPIPIIAIILILFSERARVNGPAFLAGWVIGLSAVSAVVYLVA